MPENAVGGAPRPWWSGDVGADLSGGPVVLGDRYRLVEVVGRGGVATVYRAHDEVLDRVVAVKVLPAVPRDSDDLLRHAAEIRVLAGLRHAGLVRLFDADTLAVDDGHVQAYLVMELVPGPTLGRRLADGPLTVVQTVCVGRAAAEALAVVHAHGVVHRDVKPGNILLSAADCLEGDPAPDDALDLRPVKLVDFGIARLAAATRLTLTGTIVGTATYLSPEQAVGGELGPATDVYALGLVLLECVTGRPAFVGTMAEVAAARLARDPAVPADVDPRLADVLARMTSRRPEDRPSASDVADVLTGFLAAGPALAPGSPPVAAPTLVLPVHASADAPSAAGLPAGTAPGRDLRDRRPTGEPAGHADRRPTPGPAGPPERRPGGSTGRPERPTGESTGHPGGRPGRPGRLRRLGRSGSRRVAVLATAVAAVVVAVVVVLPGTGGTTHEPAPSYPAVEGALGESLARLQQSVQP